MNKSKMNQDWTPVVFQKRPATSAAPRRPPINHEARHAASLDAETLELKHVRVPPELKRALAQARQAKGMTREEFARQLGVAPKLIVEYESGTAIPDNATISRFERALSVKLPRVRKHS